MIRQGVCRILYFSGRASLSSTWRAGLLCGLHYIDYDLIPYIMLKTEPGVMGVAFMFQLLSFPFLSWAGLLIWRYSDRV